MWLWWSSSSSSSSKKNFIVAESLAFSAPLITPTSLRISPIYLWHPFSKLSESLHQKFWVHCFMLLQNDYLAGLCGTDFFNFAARWHRHHRKRCFDHIQHYTNSTKNIAWETCRPAALYFLNAPTQLPVNLVNSDIFPLQNTSKETLYPSVLSYSRPLLKPFVSLFMPISVLSSSDSQYNTWDCNQNGRTKK